MQASVALSPQQHRRPSSNSYELVRNNSTAAPSSNGFELVCYNSVRSLRTWSTDDSVPPQPLKRQHTPTSPCVGSPDSPLAAEYANVGHVSRNHESSIDVSSTRTGNKCSRRRAETRAEAADQDEAEAHTVTGSNCAIAVATCAAARHTRLAGDLLKV